ncbi:outer dense fiber protein 4-like [Gracilinanus agilis]|uniref:outer dense fiber protein 4-like n=1 Tax=Gracilinanus agilis TaxID=191870 RepID=UPI001CFC8AAD|nr:outer dense fiber protein 4-like [Gracilinanus agilis]
MSYASSRRFSLSYNRRSSLGGEFGRWKDIQRRRTSVFPLSHRLLHQARYLSRELCLVLSLAGLCVIALLSLRDSWIRFQVPVNMSDNFTFIDIFTSIFVPCPETECMLEPDESPYYLNFSVTFILIATLISFLLCLALAYTILFFRGSVPLMDLTTTIISFSTGMVPSSLSFRFLLFLCALFYLLQARNFLQEGMSYTLEKNYYLLWLGIFFYMLTGFFCFLNYVNFWSIMAPGGTWI